MEDVNNNEKMILDYITVGEYETDAAGNLIIKTVMGDSCELLVRKMDARNFLSRAIEIKTDAPDNQETEPGFLFSVHEFFTDILLAELNEHPTKLDIGTISFASRTYNQQKNVRSIYTWTGKNAGLGKVAAGTVREVAEMVYYSVATFEADSMYRLRMYRNGSKQLHQIVMSLVNKPADYVISHPDGSDYLISPDEFDVKALEEIRRQQEGRKNCVAYSFTYDQLCGNVLVDMGEKIEFDVPDNCLLLVDDNIVADAKHIKIVEKFDITSCPNNALIVFNDGSMGLFDRYDDHRVYFIQMFNASVGTMFEHYDPDYNEFHKGLPRLATDEDVRVYNSKIRSLRLKYNPETRELSPLLNSLKPGDVYYRPEFDALKNRFVCKEFTFEGSADEFTIIIERKLGFKDKEKCETLVRTYNDKLNEAIKTTSDLSDLE